MIHQHFAYISGGRLFYVDLVSGQKREIFCEFGEKMKDRISRSYQAKDWKFQSNQQTLFSTGYSLWSDPAAQNPSYNIRSFISGASYGPAEEALFFAFDGEDVNGLFSVDIRDLREKRLFHTPHFEIRNLALSPGGNKIAYSRIEESKIENIFLLDKDTAQKVQLTEGDSIDTAPAWSTDARKIVYQSAGIGRNAVGLDISVGPFSIYELDLDHSTAEQVCEIDKKDLHNPRYSYDGEKLLFIAKPLEESHLQHFRSLINVLMIPLRLLYAIFEFLNFFVARYTGKPLLETGIFKRRTDWQQSLLLGGAGSSADIEAMAEELEEETDKVKAPRSWELIEFDRKTGEYRTLLREVSTYDISPVDGSLLFSNGRDIFKAGPDGSKPEKIYSASLVRNILWC